MEKTLLILAAGMGSRFGGLKQILPVGPNGEFIIDYSIYDAIKAGFTKVVFVIKKENQIDFENTIGKRIAKYIPVDYVYQDNDFLPRKMHIERVKPLGTGHALYCAKDAIKAPFALISADDFYGPDSFKKMSEFLDEEENKVGVVGYNLASTIPSENEVKRGIIFEDDNAITSLVECRVKNDGNYINAKEIQGSREYRLTKDMSASMLNFAFSLDIFPLLETLLNEFLDTADLASEEFILTFAIDKLIKENKAKLIKTSDKWMGMSYKEDAILVQNRIKEDIKKGIYPDNLWSE